MRTKAYTETAEETKKNNKDEGEDDGADKKKEVVNNQDTTNGLGTKNKNSNTDKIEFNNEREEATNREANTETINSESGLNQHVNKCHLNGAAAARRMEEEESFAQSTKEEATGTGNDNRQNPTFEDR